MLKIITYTDTENIEDVLNGIFYCKDVHDGQVMSNTDIKIVQTLYAADNYSIGRKSDGLEISNV